MRRRRAEVKEKTNASRASVSRWNGWSQETTKGTKSHEGFGFSASSRDFCSSVIPMVKQSSTRPGRTQVLV